MHTSCVVVGYHPRYFLGSGKEKDCTLDALRHGFGDVFFTINTYTYKVVLGSMLRREDFHFARFRICPVNFYKTSTVV